MKNFENKKMSSRDEKKLSRARSFGIKALESLKEEDDFSGSGSGWWADLAWFCDYLLYDVCLGDEDCYMEYFNWYEEFSGFDSGDYSAYDYSGFDFSGSGWDWLSMFFKKQGTKQTDVKEFMNALQKV